MKNQPQTNEKSGHSMQGFTLIEVMIAVVILAIVAGISFPIYSNYVTKTRRVDAKVMLQEIAGEQIRYFSENNQYADDLSVLGYAGETVESEEKYYNISVEVPTETNFILTATPAKDGPQADDDLCGSFTLDAAGGKGVTGSEKAIDCW